MPHMCLVPIQRLPVRGADTVDTPFEPGQCSQDVVEAFWLREINVTLEQSPSTTGFHFDAGNRCSDWITVVGFTAGYVQSFQDRSGGSGLFFQKAGEEP